MASYPAPGCIVEFLEDNAVQIAIVLEESAGKLRLLLPNRKELKLSANRLLPWPGPCYGPITSREDAVKLLEQHKATRENKTVPVLELWEMATGEIPQAPASWFAEFMEPSPNADSVAAWGRALLDCKSHFRYQPPEFQIYDAETVEKRAAEQKAREEKEALASQGTRFIKMLHEVATHKRALPPPGDEVFPPEPLANRIRHLLMARVANSESQEDEALWKLLSKGLPEVPYLPVQLLEAWGVLPQHYNFWLDRADYDPGDDWWRELEPTPSSLLSIQAPRTSTLPFISIDGPTTFDIDDAFAIEKNADGYRLTLAFACPAFGWPFGSSLDKAVASRATSIYLPEGDLHMLPVSLGTDSFSLLAGKSRPALCLELQFDHDANITECKPFLSQVTLAANLRYAQVQEIIDSEGGAQNPASQFATQLLLAHELGLLREQLRINDGAIIMLKAEPEIILKNGEKGIEVDIVPEPNLRDAQRLVSELMIAASASIADWAIEHEIPLLHRIQNVAVPKEYAGIWERPEDMARIMRALIPSSLEVLPKPHAALGLSRYAQITSPLRRYPDLVNEAQIISWLGTGKPQFDEAALYDLLDRLSPSLDAASQAQRNRPRYWKLLHLRQLGDRVWHDGIITEENDNFVSVSLPQISMYVRGKRQLFGDRATPGMAIRLRLGRIHPIANEIQILEAMPKD